MRSLYLRIYLTVLAALALFALLSGWLVQSHFEGEREAMRSVLNERTVAWAELLQRSLPAADTAPAEQVAALNDWSSRLRIPLALDDAQGRRIAASPSFERREAEMSPRRAQAIPLVDGRTLWLMRGAARQQRAAGPGMADGDPNDAAPRRPRAAHAAPWWTLPMLPGAAGLALLLLVIFAAIAAGAWPVVRRLTRRLEDLKRGVEAFGAGALHQRVAEDGRDEVAALGASFNRAAARIEALLGSHRSLLANASHELRSPLARLKMAVSLLDEAPPAQREQLKHEIHTNIGELDALVEEVLMASRLDARSANDPPPTQRIELLSLTAEEAAGRSHGQAANVEGEQVVVLGDERLLRRALRNLLDNARRYGGETVEVHVGRGADGQAEVSVCDRGPGVPEAHRERIFEAFFRLPGHAEQAGGVGLGLALVRQIAAHHGGGVRCEPRDGGGSCFRLRLPAA
ncbi:MAG: HAMP domain-containing sensor histidine kinase [Rubrivivax sp.]